MSRHPRIGRAILAVTDDPQSTKAWARGAEGERRLGAHLDTLADKGAIVLHDRRMPRSRANIDHIVVAPSGVWVIDAKHYSGQVTKRDVGGWFRRDERLYVGRRDCSSLVSAMTKQTTAVHDALAQLPPQLPVNPVVCLVAAEWRLFANPFSIQGVTVTWPKALVSSISKRASVIADVDSIASLLGRALPPAVGPHE